MKFYNPFKWHIFKTSNGDYYVSKLGFLFRYFLDLTNGYIAHAFARDPKEQLKDGDDLDDWSLELWWHRNFYPDVDMILYDLQTKGLLEDGDYQITIDW